MTDYDRYRPTGQIDLWRTIMFSNECPLVAAQASLYAYELNNVPAIFKTLALCADSLPACLSSFLASVLFLLAIRTLAFCSSSAGEFSSVKAQSTCVSAVGKSARR